MFSSYAHFDALNPLAPDVVLEPGIPERNRPRKTWSVWTELVWWLWVAGVFGWAGEVLRAWVSWRTGRPSVCDSTELISTS